MKTALCQMLITYSKSDNLTKAAAMVDEAVAHGAEVVVLPEIFNCPYEMKLFAENAEHAETGETCAMLSQKAQQHGILLIGGSIPEKIEGDELVYNTTFVFDETGKRIARHRKVHLFDVNIKGGIAFQESRAVKPGNEFNVFEWRGLKFGLMICYDVRFPESARLLALQGADVIVVPAAFNTTTGPAHWHITMRARAIESQTYLLAASPSRNMQSLYHAYGHSMVIDPWGTIKAEADETEQIIYGEIDTDRIKKVRTELPLLAHRREDVYKVLF